MAEGAAGKAVGLAGKSEARPARVSLRAVLHAYGAAVGGKKLVADIALVLASALLDAAGILLLAVVAEAHRGTTALRRPDGLVEDFLRGMPFLRLLLGFTGIFLARNLAASWRDERLEQSRQMFVTRLRERAFGALTGARWDAFFPQSFAEIEHVHLVAMEKVERGLEALARLPATICFVLATLLVVAAALPLKLGVLALAGMSLFFLVQIRVVREQAAGTESSRLAKELTAGLHTLLGAMKLFKSHGAEEEHRSRFFALLRRRIASASTRRRRRIRIRLLLQCALGIGLAGLFYAGETRQLLTRAQMVLIALLVSRLAPQMRTMQRAWMKGVETPVHFAEIQALELRLTEHAEPAPAASPSKIVLARSLALERVSFRYGSHAAVLEDLSLELPAHSLTVITGPSGAGKTTLMDLLVGLHRPASGAMRVDGRLLREEDLTGWRRSIGYVPQDVALMHGTIRDNLLWLRSQATDIEIWNALAKSQALDFVEALPAGLDTMVGEHGMRLSGGQRQRIALARAVLLHPSLLVLDEVTSALDSDTEKAVARGLRSLAAEMTIVAVSHRRALLLAADQVLHMEEGRLRRVDQMEPEVAHRR